MFEFKETRINSILIEEILSTHIITYMDPYIKEGNERIQEPSTQSSPV